MTSGLIIVASIFQWGATAGWSYLSWKAHLSRKHWDDAFAQHFWRCPRCDTYNLAKDPEDGRACSKCKSARPDLPRESVFEIRCPDCERKGHMKKPEA